MLPEKPSKRPANFARQFALAMELPFILVGAVLVSGLLGFLLDRWLGTKPYFMLGLGAVGFYAGVRDLLRRLQKVSDGGGSQTNGQE